MKRVSTIHYWIFKMTKSINFINYMPHADTAIGLPFELVDASNTLIRCMYEEINTRYGSEEHAKNLINVLIGIQSKHDENLAKGMQLFAEYPGEVSSRMRLSPVLEKDGQKVQTLIAQVIVPLNDCNSAFTMAPYCLILSEDLKTWKEIALLVVPQGAVSENTKEAKGYRPSYETAKTVLKTSLPVRK